MVRLGKQAQSFEEIRDEDSTHWITLLRSTVSRTYNTTFHFFKLLTADVMNYD